MTIDGKEKELCLFENLTIGTPFVFNNKFYFKTDKDKAKYFIELNRFDFNLSTKMEDFTKEVIIDSYTQVNEMFKAQVSFGVNI
jgi:hypothetical protein